LYRLDRSAAGGDDVLDQADPVALVVNAFELVRRAVLLGSLPDDQKGQAGLQRGRRGQRDSAQLGAGEPVGIGLVLANRRGERTAERREHVRASLEAILVEVVAGAAARPKDEVALEVRRFAQRTCELLARHLKSSCAIGSRRSASGVPAAYECMEPSSP